jgi:hypothetical protein
MIKYKFVFAALFLPRGRHFFAMVPAFRKEAFRKEAFRKVPVFRKVT